MKRTFIPPSLRPTVTGATVEVLANQRSPKQRAILPTRICIVGLRNDPVIQWFRSHLRHETIPHWFVDFCSAKAISRATSEITDLIRRGIDEVRIFVRPVRARTQEGNDQISVFLDTLSLYRGLVVNSLDSMVTNGSKPLHLTKLSQYLQDSQIGIAIPETRISNRPNGFYLSANICKSLSAVRSTVHLIDKIRQYATGGDTQQLVLIQKYIKGASVRVHVVGTTCVGLIVESQHVDYRIDDKASFLHIDLPESIKRVCIELTRAEGLHFSGIDFVVRDDGAWFLLEANPTPAFHYFEKNTSDRRKRRQISNLLLGYLISGGVSKSSLSVRPGTS
jgi:RimK-like ATP-grasp domain